MSRFRALNRDIILGEKSARIMRCGVSVLIRRPSVLIRSNGRVTDGSTLRCYRLTDKHLIRWFVACDVERVHSACPHIRKRDAVVVIVQPPPF